LDQASDPGIVSDTKSVTGIILAGGSSSRLGHNKALVNVAGRPLVAGIAEKLCSVVSETVLVTNEPEQFAFLGLSTAGDVYRGIGVLGGLHAGLKAIRTEYGLVVGCDMPFLNADLLRYMISQAPGYDIVMPRIGKYHEPLHAVYARRCLPVIEQSILSGQRRVLEACEGMQVHYVEEEEIARYDPLHLSFFNVNAPDDLERMAEILQDDVTFLQL